MVGASARGMPLLMRHHEAGTHGVIRGLVSIFSAAFTNANAAQSRMSKAAVIIRKFEVGFRIPWMIVRSKPQIFIHAVRIHDLSRIHFPVRVPDRFKFTKSLDQFISEHLVKKFSAGLPISMLAAETAVILHAKVGGFLHERAPLFNSRLRGHIKINTAVDASL